MNRLQTIDADTLQSTAYEPVSFVVDDLLPQGLHLLAGAPKIGKSWLALWLCLCAAQGKPLWTFATHPCEVLYLCLEDSFQRIQSRLFDLTEDAPPTLHFAVMSQQLHNGLVEQIEQFLKEHPKTRLIVIDTLQRIRTAGNDANPYASDYRDIGVLKALADKYRIAILLVHHLRKMNDRDPVNKLSGSTGISGAVDAIFVLDKNERIERFATLYASGRDIRDRKIQLELDKDACVWTLIADSLTMPETMLPDEMAYVFGFVWRSKNHGFVGTNTELAQHVSSALGKEVNPKGLKQMMNRYRYQLEDLGVFFESKRSNGQKYVVVKYRPPSDGDSSALSDSVSSALTDSVPSVPCVPAGDVG